MAQVLDVKKVSVKNVEKLIISTEKKDIWVSLKQYNHLTQGKLSWEDLVGCTIMYSYFKKGEKSGEIEVKEDGIFLRTLSIVTSNVGMLQVALTEGAAQVIEKFSLVKAVKLPSFNPSKYFTLLEGKSESIWQEVLEDEGLSMSQIKETINKFAAHLAKSVPDPAVEPVEDSAETPF